MMEKKNFVLFVLGIATVHAPAHAMLRGTARVVGAAAHDDAAVSRVARQFGRVTLSDGASAVGRGVARRAPVCGAASGAAGAAQSAGQGVSWGRVAAVRAGGALLIAGTAFGVQEYIFSRDDKGKFPIHHAVADGELERVRVLLLLGADPNVADYEGTTPLHKAAEIGDVKKIELLLRFGASVNAENRYGWTPLMEAVPFGKVEAVRVLLRECVKINHADGFGRTALHIAFARKANTDDSAVFCAIVNMLLAAGADKGIKDAAGRTPVDVYLEEQKFKEDM